MEQCLSSTTGPSASLSVVASTPFQNLAAEFWGEKTVQRCADLPPYPRSSPPGAAEEHSEKPGRSSVELCSAEPQSESRTAPADLERLEDALKTVALAIEEDGPVYLPLFERIEAEIAEKRGGVDALSRARRLARG